jgi:urease accessory protein
MAQSIRNTDRASAVSFSTRPRHSPAGGRLCCARIATAIGLALVVQAAHAHSEATASGGFLRGFLHPLTGGDHLLAMVAVGIWGAVLGAPLLWLLPVAFPMLMVLGAVSAMAGLALPAIEPGIALSVLVLGSAIAAFWRAPIPAALAVVAFFGILHGFAHGRELPQSALPAAYAAGFVLASGLLHGTGIAIGSICLLPRGHVVLRALGASFAVMGAWLLLGHEL